MTNRDKLPALVISLMLPLLFFQTESRGQPVRGALLPSSLRDRGIWDDLDSRARVSIPSWLPQGQLKLYRWTPPSSSEEVAGLMYQNHLLALFTLHQGHLSSADRDLINTSYPALSTADLPSLPKRLLRGHDQDGDHIFDTLDLHIGAIKTKLNGASYQEGYERIKYPLGDVSREKGVCTDVVIRALRNAGWDLQELLYNDMLASPRSYGLKGKPNRHIDHRRVRRLIVYFQKHFKSLPIEFNPDQQTGDDAWLPGDLIFMDTLQKGRPTHVGLVAGELGPSGMPLIINNWTYGYKTSSMDLKEAAVWLSRFRITAPR